MLGLTSYQENRHFSEILIFTCNEIQNLHEPHRCILICLLLDVNYFKLIYHIFIIHFSLVLMIVHNFYTINVVFLNIKYLQKSIYDLEENIYQFRHQFSLKEETSREKMDCENEQLPKIKIPKWGKCRSGMCHQLMSKIKGVGSFKQNVWSD